MAKDQEKKIKIDNKTVFFRNQKDFLKTEVDGEAVMMNTNDGTYWGLNVTSTDIWNLLDAPLSFEKIIDHLMGKYEVPLQDCRKETANVLMNMYIHGILKIQET